MSHQSGDIYGRMPCCGAPLALPIQHYSHCALYKPGPPIRPIGRLSSENVFGQPGSENDGEGSRRLKRFGRRDPAHCGFSFTRQRKKGGRMSEQPKNQRETKLLLKLRSAIADKEWITACANMDTARAGSWTCDWHEGMRQAQKEIDEILKKLDEIAEGEES